MQHTYIAFVILKFKLRYNQTKSLMIVSDALYHIKNFVILTETLLSRQSKAIPT